MNSYGIIILAAVILFIILSCITCICVCKRFKGDDRGRGGRRPDGSHVTYSSWSGDNGWNSGNYGDCGD